MVIKRFHVVGLTQQTCMMHVAKEGFACNKTVFLLHEKGEKRWWTVMHYENDRFGLLNGILYLKGKSTEPVNIFFTGNDVHDACGFTVSRDMSFTEISKMVDILYLPSVVVYK